MNLFRLFSPHLTKIRAFIYTILIIVTFLGLCNFIFHFFGQMDFFHALLEKAGVSLGGRALSFALCKRLGCSRGLTLAIIFAVSILFTADGRPSLGKMVLPEGSEPSVNQGPGGMTRVLQMWPLLTLLGSLFRKFPTPYPPFPLILPYPLCPPYPL